MKSLVVIVLATVIAVLFVFANSHHVEVSLIFGAPVRLRMIFLLMGVYVAGALSTIIFQQWQRAKRRRDFEKAQKATPPVEDEHRDLIDLGM